MSAGHSEFLRWQAELHPSTRAANLLQIQFYWNSERLLRNQVPNTLKSYSASISSSNSPYIINYKISTGNKNNKKSKFPPKSNHDQSSYLGLYVYIRRSTISYIIGGILSLDADSVSADEKFHNRRDLANNLLKIRY